MKVLVLGGTGAMGIDLVQILAGHGHEVYVTSRTQSGRNVNISYVTGNAQNEYFLDQLLSQKWDVIVDFMVYSTAIFKNRYQKFLISTEHYIFLSSSRVYADSNMPLIESSARLLDISNNECYLASDEYALTKARQEDLLFNSEYKNWSIIRPYITYNTERLQLGVLEKEDWLYRAVNGRSIVTAQDIQTKKTTLTSGKDVAIAIAALVGNKKAKGEAFHITGDKSITWGEVANIYLKTLTNYGIDAKIIEQNLESFLEWRQGEYQVIYDRLYNRTFDNSKINQFVDTSLFMCPKKGLTECLVQFLKAKPFNFHTPNWQEEALKDRLSKQKTPLNEISGIKQKIKYFLFKNLPMVARLTTQ